MKEKGLAPIVIVILVAVVLGISGYLIYRWVKPAAPSITSLVGILLRDKIKQNQPTQAPSSTPDVTANWKKYVNEKHKYSVDYPSIFQVIEAKIGNPTKECCATVLLKNELQKVTFSEKSDNLIGESTIIVYSNPRNLTLEQWTYEHYLFTRVDGEKVDQRTGNSNLDGKLAITALLFEFDRHRKTITTLYNGNFYEIIFDEINPNDQKLDEHKKIYNQILSTFKFIN